MKRLLVFAPALFLAAPALAQTVPEGAYKDLWCGLAFSTPAVTTPIASPEELAAAHAAGAAGTEDQIALAAQDDMIQGAIAGGIMLLERGTAAYKGAGFTDEQFATTRADLETSVNEQVMGLAADADFTFDDCLALIPGEAPVTPAP